MNKIKVSLQTLESITTPPNSNTKNWNNCDVCSKEMGLTHYTIVISDITLVNWVCSEECINMFIFQNI
jgi:hypothetical protein